MNNMVSIIDSNNNVIKSVYTRFAVQQVLKGKATWINSNTIQLIEPIPIVKVFSKINTSFTIQDAMSKLTSIFANELFPQKKAAAALGGASRSGFIEFKNGIWTRIR